MMKDSPEAPRRALAARRLAQIKLNRVGSLLGEICDLLGRDEYVVEYERSGSPAPLPLPSPTDGPSRSRNYAFPPTSVTHSWEPTFDTHKQVTTGLEKEFERRKQAAIEWSAANHSYHRIPDLRLFQGYDSAFLHEIGEAGSESPLQFRTRHHAECASNFSASAECDCSPLFLVRAGGSTFQIGNNGDLTPYVEPPLTHDHIVFFNPATWKPGLGLQLGFLGEPNRDRFGRLLVPIGTPFVEFSDGTISFQDPAIRRPRHSIDPS